MPDVLDLVALFASLRPPAAGAGRGIRFSALPIPGYERHRLGKDEQGAPSLLVAVADAPGQVWPAPIVLEHLAVQHDIACYISRPDGPIEEGRFTVMRCAGIDPTLHAYFLRVAAALVAVLGSTPTSGEVTRAINTLVELFRALMDTPRKSVQGLWAELLLIARARDPAALVSAWHVLPSDRYDFSAGCQRVEVKSAASRVRQHHFTLEQLRIIAGTQVLIASVLVERAGAGTSILHLVEEARSRLGDNSDLLLRLDRVVSLTLGNSWRLALEERFDRELAESSLAFYEPTVIPQVGATLPAGVSDVHFKSDLTGVPTADIAVYRAMEGLFRAVLRR